MAVIRSARIAGWAFSVLEEDTLPARPRASTDRDIYTVPAGYVVIIREVCYTSWGGATGQVLGLGVRISGGYDISIMTLEYPAPMTALHHCNTVLHEGDVLHCVTDSPAGSLYISGAILPPK